MLNPTLRLVGVPVELARKILSANPAGVAASALSGLGFGLGTAVAVALTRRSSKRNPRKRGRRSSNVGWVKLEEIYGRIKAPIVKLAEHGRGALTELRKLQNKRVALGRSNRKRNGLFGCGKTVVKVKRLVGRKLRTVSERAVIRSNPTGQRLSDVKILPWSEARRAPGFAAALRGYRRFHGAGPVHATRVRVADGSRAVTRRTVFAVGEAPSVEYQTWKHQRSNKAGKPGETIVWRHKMGERGGKRPLLVHDPRTRITSFLGGTYGVTDWFNR